MKLVSSHREVIWSIEVYSSMTGVRTCEVRLDKRDVDILLEQTPENLYLWLRKLQTRFAPEENQHEQEKN